MHTGKKDTSGSKAWIRIDSINLIAQSNQSINVMHKLKQNILWFFHLIFFLQKLSFSLNVNNHFAWECPLNYSMEWIHTMSKCRNIVHIVFCLFVEWIQSIYLFQHSFLFAECWVVLPVDICRHEDVDQLQLFEWETVQSMKLVEMVLHAYQPDVVEPSQQVIIKAVPLYKRDWN